MKSKKKDKRIGIILDENNYKNTYYLWLPLAKSLLKDGAEIWLLPDLNYKFLNKNVFDCFITFSPVSQEDDFSEVPFLTVENKISGHPNISFSPVAEKTNETDVLKADVEQFVSISSGIITKLLSGAENILNRACQAFYEPKMSATLEKISEKEKIFNKIFFNTIGVTEREKFFAILKEQFPKIGIKNAMIVLNERIFPELKKTARLFSDKLENEKVFDEREILPESEFEKFEESFFDLRPLQNFDDKGAIDGTNGYFITEISSEEFEDFDRPKIFGKLVELLSKKIKSVSAYEKIKAEKEIAEKNSYEKTEFFANMGNDLCEPLENIRAKISQMSDNIENNLCEKDIIIEQLLFLKSQIDTQLEKTRTLIELSATQLDDFELEKALFNPKKIFPTGTNLSGTKKFPLLFGDKEKIQNALSVITQESKTETTVELNCDGIVLKIRNAEGKNFDFRKAKFALAEKILLLHCAEIVKAPMLCQITFPYPNLLCQNFAKADSPSEIYSLSSDRKISAFAGEKIFDLPVKNVFGKAEKNLEKEFSRKATRKRNLLYWEADSASADEWVKIYSFRKNEKIFKTPIICFSESFEGKDFISGLEEKFHATKTETVLFINTRKTKYGTWATERNSVLIQNVADFENVLKDITPSLIVFEKVDEATMKKIRKHPKTVMTPILVIPEDNISEEDVEKLCKYPRVIFCNHGACESKEFNQRVLNIMNGEEILPPHTGALVKKAILYLNENSSQQIVRWKLADSVHVSEDYLTRVFHQEIGLSLWEYLNRYRIFLATRMLLETNKTIYEIAETTGFQDQAYFCRVFKKIYGIPPGKVRSR